MNLKALKLLRHLKGKLKDGLITATAGYAENLLVMLASLINSIDLHSFYIIELHNSFISLLLFKYCIVLSQTWFFVSSRL